jgi:hypothetical protein
MAGRFDATMHALQAHRIPVGALRMSAQRPPGPLQQLAKDSTAYADAAISCRARCLQLIVVAWTASIERYQSGVTRNPAKSCIRDGSTHAL